ncbi:rod-binding protein [Planctomicrobium piriforme]|uniref:Flagellar protein FlgJ n=1 Tax=Planctomicrobium piriforme TaxID=1576369 RepID=A0A1I3HKY4_9PLAN|nr:rod-binding protein [Planctomicrobium piriforme]SFI36395.1 flagellar protein FlgJ [Planctomicrobium piriforme]
MTPIGSGTQSLSFSSSPLMGDDVSSLKNRDPKELAKQFEGVFTSMLLKQMRQSSAEGEGLFPGDASDTYGGMFDMYLGQHIAESGGIGMAESIQAAIEKRGV